MPPRVGHTELAAAFYTGNYQRVLASSVDSTLAGAENPADLCFAIGALAFVGRTVEAELLFEGLERPRDIDSARTLAASSFFLAVACCRSGQLQRAASLLTSTIRRTGGHRDPWSRSLLLQGLACCHYFGASYHRAERSVIRALGSAHRARFGYAQLLANDMRGHLLIRRGRFHEGVAVLERARGQALNLGLANNAHAIEISVATTRASIAPPRHAISILSELENIERAEDSYSRRSILVEKAIRHAWCGEADSAAELIRAAEPLSAGSPRAEAALLCARAHLARFSRGWPEALEAIAAAEKILPFGQDPALEAELIALRLRAAQCSGDADDGRAHERRLRDLAELTGLYRAAALLHTCGVGAGLELATEDRASVTARACLAGSIPAVLEAGVLGLVPELYGTPPGRRIYVRDDALIIEDHGNVAALPALSPRCRSLLTAIWQGAETREQILRAVWGLSGYDPERHDSVIKTTLSRLRGSLGRASAWLLTEGSCYRIASAVEVMLPEVAACDRTASTHHQVPPPARRRAARWRRLVLAVDRDPDASPGDLARALGAPLRTVSRDLGALCARNQLVRIGAGPATRYRLPSTPTGNTP